MRLLKQSIAALLATLLLADPVAAASFAHQDVATSFAASRRDFCASKFNDQALVGYITNMLSPFSPAGKHLEATHVSAPAANQLDRSHIDTYSLSPIGRFIYLIKSEFWKRWIRTLPTNVIQTDRIPTNTYPFRYYPWRHFHIKETYHPAYNWVIQHIRWPANHERRILDIGARDGVGIAQVAARHDAEPWMIDAHLVLIGLNPDTGTLVRAEGIGHGLKGDIRNTLPYVRDNSFTAVTMVRTLGIASFKHSSKAAYGMEPLQPAQTIAEIYRLLAPGGQLLIWDYTSDLLVAQVDLPELLKASGFSIDTLDYVPAGNGRAIRVNARKSAAQAVYPKTPEERLRQGLDPRQTFGVGLDRPRFMPTRAPNEDPAGWSRIRPWLVRGVIQESQAKAVFADFARTPDAVSKLQMFFQKRRTLFLYRVLSQIGTASMLVVIISELILAADSILTWWFAPALVMAYLAVTLVHELGHAVVLRFHEYPITQFSWGLLRNFVDTDQTHMTAHHGQQVSIAGAAANGITGILAGLTFLLPLPFHMLPLWLESTARGFQLFFPLLNFMTANIQLSSGAADGISLLRWSVIRLLGRDRFELLFKKTPLYPPVTEDRMADVIDPLRQPSRPGLDRPRFMPQPQRSNGRSGVQSRTSPQQLNAEFRTLTVIGTVRPHRKSQIEVVTRIRFVADGSPIRQADFHYDPLGQLKSLKLDWNRASAAFPRTAIKHRGGVTFTFEVKNGVPYVAVTAPHPSDPGFVWVYSGYALTEIIDGSTVNSYVTTSHFQDALGRVVPAFESFDHNDMLGYLLDLKNSQPLDLLYFDNHPDDWTNDRYDGDLFISETARWVSIAKTREFIRKAYWVKTKFSSPAWDSGNRIIDFQSTDPGELPLLDAPLVTSFDFDYFSWSEGPLHDEEHILRQIRALAAYGHLWKRTFAVNFNRSSYSRNWHDGTQERDYSPRRQSNFILNALVSEHQQFWGPVHLRKVKDVKITKGRLYAPDIPNETALYPPVTRERMNVARDPLRNPMGMGERPRFMKPLPAGRGSEDFEPDRKFVETHKHLLIELKKTHRIILHLRYIERKLWAEVGSALNIADSTARHIAATALRELRKLVDSGEYSDSYIVRLHSDRLGELKPDQARLLREIFLKDRTMQELADEKGVWITVIRRRVRAAMSDLIQLVSPDSQPIRIETFVSDQHFVRNHKDRIQELEDRYVRILTLRFLEDKSPKEVGAALGIRPDNIYEPIKTAVVKLRELVGSGQPSDLHFVRTHQHLLPLLVNPQHAYILTARFLEGHVHAAIAKNLGRVRSSIVFQERTALKRLKELADSKKLAHAA